MRKSTLPLSPHCAAILSALRGGPHTTLELQREIGLTCVSSRVHELRAIGYPVDTTLVKVPNRRGERCTVALYSLKRRRTTRVLRDSGRRAARKRA